MDPIGSANQSAQAESDGLSNPNPNPNPNRGLGLGLGKKSAADLIFADFFCRNDRETVIES